MRARPGASETEWLHGLATIVAALMVLATVVGLAVDGVYRDNALVSAGWKGNDVVTLLVGVPLLVAATWGSARGSRRARLVLLGMLLYASYSYAFYLFGAAFNALFLVYVAIVTASGIGLLLGLLDLDASRLGSGVRSTVAVRTVAAFMIVVGVLLGGFWIILSVAYLFTGEPPPMVTGTGHPTNVTGALDLSLVVPLSIVGGLWLRRGRPWGYVLAVVWNVKGAVYMLALSAATASAYIADAAEDLAQLWLWGPIAVGCVLATAVLLRRPVNGAQEIRRRQKRTG